MELQEEVMTWQKTLSDNNVEMQKKQKEVLEPILDKMKGVVEKFAKEKGVLMILEKTAQNLVYASAEVDLTDDIIKAFEKEK